MDRRTFISKGLYGSLALAALPHFSFNTYKQDISYLELIGKGNPQLVGQDYLLRKEASEAFLEMKEEALKSDLNLKIVSSYRSYNHQNRIWIKKYKKNSERGLTPEKNIERIIKYSTIPGTSRHHWGTEIDIIDANAIQPRYVLQPKHFENGGCYQKLKDWLDSNAERFGYVLVYTNDNNRKGFNYEPWHYSFKPLSKGYLEQFLELDLKSIITKEELLGKDHFSNEFISKYLEGNICDINPDLL